MFHLYHILFICMKYYETRQSLKKCKNHRMDSATEVHLLFRPMFSHSFLWTILSLHFYLVKNFISLSLSATELIDRVTADKNKVGINNKKCLFF